MFGLTVLLFLLSFVLPATKIPPLLTIAAVVGIFSFGLWRIASWSERDGWSDRHWLSLVIGLVGWYLLVWGPLVEFVVRLPLREGLTLANFIVMIALFLLDWRLRRRHTLATPAHVGSESWAE